MYQAFRNNLLPSYSGCEYNLLFYPEFGGTNFPSPRNVGNFYQTKRHHVPLNKIHHCENLVFYLLKFIDVFQATSGRACYKCQAVVTCLSVCENEHLFVIVLNDLRELSISILNVYATCQYMPSETFHQSKIITLTAQFTLCHHHIEA